MSSLSRELSAHHIRGCALPRYGACDRAISRNNAGYIIGQSMRLQLECRRLAGPINRQMSLATQCVCTAASPPLAQGDGCAVMYCVRFARWLLYCTVGLVVYFRRAAGGLWLDSVCMHRHWYRLTHNFQRRRAAMCSCVHRCYVAITTRRHISQRPSTTEH